MQAHAENSAEKWLTYRSRRQAPGSEVGPGMGSNPHGTTIPTPGSGEAR